MATITAHATASSTTSGATLTVTAITAAVGDVLILECMADNAGTAGVSSTSASITDAAGNTWTRQSVTNNSPANAVSDGGTLSIWTCFVTAALAAASIDINFSPNTTSKAAILWKIVPAAGEVPYLHAVGAGQTGTASGTWSAPSVSVPQGYTIFGVVGNESRVANTADSDTTNGSWSTDQTALADTGTAGTSIAIGGQWKTVTATGLQTYDRNSGTAREWAANYIIIAYASTGASAGTGAATGVPTLAGSAAGIGAASAVPTITGVAAGVATADASVAGVFGTSSGSATVLGVPTMFGSAAGVGAAAAVATIVGTAAGIATVTAALAGVRGRADGSATVLGFPGVSIGAAAGAATATAIALIRGIAQGIASALGVPLLANTVVAAIVIVEAADRVAADVVPGLPRRLPRPTIAGYSFAPAAAAKRLPLEIGAARVYRKTSLPPAEVSVMWQLTSFHMKLFDGFQRSILKEGQSWFSLTLGFPSGLRTAAARFKDKMAFRARGGDVWQVKATLELLQRPTMTDAELTAVIGAGTDWPATYLPRALLASWELQPQPVTIRTDDLPGLPQARQRSRDSITDVPAEWELTATQAALFDAFFTHRGRDGAAWFSYPLHQAKGVAPTMVRFSGASTWTPRAGGGWAVAAPLEIRERAVMTAAETTAVLRA